jgi:hypothetical protein
VILIVDCVKTRAMYLMYKPELWPFMARGRDCPSARSRAQGCGVHLSGAKTLHEKVRSDQVPFSHLIAKHSNYWQILR